MKKLILATILILTVLTSAAFSQTVNVRDSKVKTFLLDHARRATTNETSQHKFVDTFNFTADKADPYVISEGSIYAPHKNIYSVQISWRIRAKNRDYYNEIKIPKSVLELQIRQQMCTKRVQEGFKKLFTGYNNRPFVGAYLEIFYESSPVPTHGYRIDGEEGICYK